MSISQRIIQAEHGDLARWLLSKDVGLSSRFMAAVALGGPMVTRDLPQERAWMAAPHPLDRDDFGRCLGLVAAVPSVRNAFPVIREQSPEWRAIIDAWQALEDSHWQHEWCEFDRKLIALIKASRQVRAS